MSKRRFPVLDSTGRHHAGTVVFDAQQFMHHDSGQPAAGCLIGQGLVQLSGEPVGHAFNSDKDGAQSQHNTDQNKNFAMYGLVEPFLEQHKYRTSLAFIGAGIGGCPSSGLRAERQALHADNIGGTGEILEFNADIGLKKFYAESGFQEQLNGRVAAMNKP